MGTIIDIVNLTKIYKLKRKKNEIVALNNINLSIQEGEIFGLLGPNGAGKTTLIQILATLLQPTSGHVIINQHNILKNTKQAKTNISLMLGSEMLYYRVSGYDNLKFFCKIYSISDYKKKILNWAKDFGIDKWLNQYVEKYSSGMKMKLALIRTLLLDRKILILDEPTLGLDVKSINLIVEKLLELKKTIFLTSHDMNVIEKLCDRIAFINKGNILKIGTKNDIKKIIGNEINIIISISNNNKDFIKKELNQLDFVNSISKTEEGLAISLRNRKFLPYLLKILSKYEILFIKQEESSLNDLFLNLA